MSASTFLRSLARGLPVLGPVLRDRDALVQRLEQLSNAVGEFPPGHFYSPIPDGAQVRQRLGDVEAAEALSVTGVDLRIDAQKELFLELRDAIAASDLADEPTEGVRYHLDNGYFVFADGLFLSAFLRTHRPARIVEVGSGFSSALMLDTLEVVDEGLRELTFIEPYPERLNSLLRPADRDRCAVLEQPVQDVSMDLFTGLEAGDLLFIDSSHVSACGSDVNHLMFEVLPRLAPGVFVHIHDMFFPFEYPRPWLEAGRYWSEAYLVRAFLSGNTEWEIHWFNSLMGSVLEEELSTVCPAWLRNTGASLYLRKR